MKSQVTTALLLVHPNIDSLTIALLFYFFFNGKAIDVVDLTISPAKDKPVAVGTLSVSPVSMILLLYFNIILYLIRLFVQLLLI